MFGGIILITFVLFLFRPTTPSQEQVIPTPTPIPNVLQNPNSATEVFNTLNNREDLSPSDTQAKENILQTVNNTTGTVYESPTVAIFYLATPDLFQAQIRTTDTNQAKNDAINWLISQGLSRSSICHLPLIFYLSTDTAATLKDSNQSFSPKVPGC
jgi:hypothetical protein